MNDQSVDEMTFEEAMRALEEVVGKLERGDVPLDDSIALYERGAALKARCEAKLKEAVNTDEARFERRNGECRRNCAASY